MSASHTLHTFKYLPCARQEPEPSQNTEVNWKLIHPFLPTSKEDTIDTKLRAPNKTKKSVRTYSHVLGKLLGEQKLPAEPGKRALRACGDDDQRMSESHPETRKGRELRASSTPVPY